MRKFLQKILKRPISALADRFSSAPDRDAVFQSLNGLLEEIENGKQDSGPVRDFDSGQDRFIIFSDQHKGARNEIDDFKKAEKNYLAALEYYDAQQFQFINLGDCEELWKNRPDQVIKPNSHCLEAEKKFLDRDAYFRIFGNHDLIWKFALQQNIFLKPIFGNKLRVFEGMVLRTRIEEKTYSIFLAHGHQGDKRNDGNAFSIWFVANFWTPVQRYLDIHVDTPATSFDLTDRHNIMMYDWSATRQDLILISGHTHKPVFASLDHLDRLSRDLEMARTAGDQGEIEEVHEELEKRKPEYAGKRSVRTEARPSYFNSGCCCFSDGDITGIEIAEGRIRLIKWDRETEEAIPKRTVLEEALLSEVLRRLRTVR
jgi:UDP-2,3-diacylglucosamine pyrophosphatase LpxH